VALHRLVGLVAIKVVLEDSLGIGEELEQEMARIVDSYQCEWQTTLNEASRSQIACHGRDGSSPSGNASAGSGCG
jgi:NAD(P)H-nitrite reductase large subunit